VIDRGGSGNNLEEASLSQLVHLDLELE
jgi:hypothetical protein